MTVVILATGKSSGDAGMADASIFKLVRLLRLSRMARLARLLHRMPDLMILVKGIGVATRSVFFTLCLLIIIIYVFAVGLTQVTDGVEPLHSRYFGNVLESMSTLLLRGTLPDLADLVNTMGRANYVFACVMLLFILMSSLTVMNMLVGVLVEVVSVVAAVEKEQMTMQYVKTSLQSMLRKTGMGDESNLAISRHEFEALILKPEAARIIQDVGVDVVGLVDFLDFIFKDGHKLSFPEFMDVVLQMRGCNNATVRDVVDLRKYVHNQMNDAVSSVTETVNSLKMNGVSTGAGHNENKSLNHGAAFIKDAEHNNDNTLTPPDFLRHVGQQICMPPAVCNTKPPSGKHADSQAPQVRSNIRCTAGTPHQCSITSPGNGCVYPYGLPACPAFPDHWLSEIQV